MKEGKLNEGQRQERGILNFSKRRE